MATRVNLPLVDEETFRVIYYNIMRNPKERKEFFSNPKKVFAERGIAIDKKTLELLKKIFNFNIKKNSADFNEKLVLCSSSGY